MPAASSVHKLNLVTCIVHVGNHELFIHLMRSSLQFFVCVLQEKLGSPVKGEGATVVVNIEESPED